MNFDLVAPVLHFTQFHVRLTVDGAVHELRGSSVMVMNLGSVVGGLIKFGAGIRHDDGVLHACVYSPPNVGAALLIFGRMLNGTVQNDPSAFCIAGRTFRLETDPPRGAQADGELVGNTPLDITVEPGAARLLVPKLR